MKGLDDGVDGLNDAAFERALGGGSARHRRPALVPAAAAPRTAAILPTADGVTEIVLHAIALADSVGVVGSLSLHPGVAPDALLAWADRGSIFVAAEELTRIRCGVTIRWTLYSVTFPGGSVVTAHGPDREDRPVVGSTVESDELPAVAF